MLKINTFSLIQHSLQIFCIHLQNAIYTSQHTMYFSLGTQLSHFPKRWRHQTVLSVLMNETTSISPVKTQFYCNHPLGFPRTPLFSCRLVRENISRDDVDEVLWLISFCKVIRFEM